MKVKAGRPLIDTIKLAYTSNTPCLLTGSHGIGKSVILEEAAREMGIEFMTLNLSLLENVDLQGIPTVKDGVTVYNPPVILPRSGRGLLSLEEINRADRSVLSCALLLLSLRRLNSFELPSGWLPVASMNPMDGGMM
jgi:MoxR-like ATPase